jgi:hypothetical protein
MAIGSFGSGYEASGLTKDAVADFIRSEARRLGIDPEVALRVAKTEGFNSYQSTVQLPGGGRERSYGPFQLYMGGGLGNEFEKATGINPERDRSDASVKAGITYALQHAATKGWGAFHGARNNGIGNRDGIGGGPAAPVQGGGTQQMNPLLLMQNQSIQEQPQQGGLAGMFNDPGKLAALQLLISGLNPWSKGDELAPFARLAQLRQTQGYERQKDERDYKLREQQFQLGRQDREEDNKRADARLKFDQDQAALSPAVKAARDVGLTDPNDPKYRQFIEQYYRKGMTPTIEDQVTERKKAAVTIGLKENSPEYRAYVLTGKMPREDQQPLSATDKKAIMEADEGVMAAQTAITALGEAKALSKKAYEGPFAGQRGYATGLIGSEGGQATTDLNNLVMSNALSQLKSIFGAAPTEGERKILLEIQGSVSQPDAVRQKIYDRAIALAERRLQFNKQRADELRGGSFYKQPGAGGSAPSAPSPTTGLAPGSYDWDGSKLVPRK